jgi:hypothetical protein
MRPTVTQPLHHFDLNPVTRLQISPTTFSEIVNDVNTLLIEAHNPARTWIDNSAAILTFYLSSTLFGTHYARVCSLFSSSSPPLLPISPA